MNYKQVSKKLDSFEKQFDKTIQEFKALLKAIRTEIKNSNK